MKCSKTILASILAAAMIVPSVGVTAFAAEDTKETNVKYTVSQSYTWNIHSEIDFGTTPTDSSTTIAKTDNVVSVSKNVIPDGATLNISVKGSGTDGAFTIANGNTILNYTITKDSSNIATGNNVLSVAAGKNSDSASLTFTLNTLATSNSAEVSGNYTGSVIYTATVTSSTTQNN